MTIFRKKKKYSNKTEMQRHFKVIDLVFLGLGSMVGTGIFTVTGIGAAKYAGPALTISIIISAIAIGILALFYAEFASRMPSNGGAYIMFMQPWESFQHGLLAGILLWNF
ncbi:amino acid permease [Streptococcus pyogenes]|nr:amino acid permease [Streptococcus pyogenes]